LHAACTGTGWIQRQSVTDLLEIAEQLVFQLPDCRKGKLVADPVDDFDFDELIVQVGGEIEDVRFDLSGVVAEGWHGADA